MGWRSMVGIRKGKNRSIYSITFVHNMRSVIQSVTQSQVSVNGRVVGKIRKGLVVLLAMHKDDTSADVEWMARKISRLRIFSDNNGKINRSLQDIGGSLLIISQFTLYGSCVKGNRPSFTDSASSEQAYALYQDFVKYMKALNLDVQTGEFQKHMLVSLTNDGPATLILDSR